MPHLGQGEDSDSVVSTMLTLLKQLGSMDTGLKEWWMPREWYERITGRYQRLGREDVENVLEECKSKLGVSGICYVCMLRHIIVLIWPQMSAVLGPLFYQLSISIMHAFVH